MKSSPSIPTPRAIAAIAAAALVAAACGSDADSGADTANETDSAVDANTVSIENPGVSRDTIDAIVDGTLVIPDGAYEVVGYGIVLDVDGDSIVMHHVTNSTCAVGDDFDNELPVDHADDDGGVITFDDVGSTTDYRLRQLVDAPDCTTSSDDPITALDEVFSTHYPFFDERGVDWDTELATIRSAFDDDPTALQPSLANFMLELGDGHTAFDELDIPFDPADFGVDGVESPDDVGQLFGDELDATLARVAEITTDETGTLAWGSLGSDPTTGYLLIGGFEGLAGDDDPASDRAAMIAGLDTAIDDLSSTVDRLIVDMRFNGGGYEDLAVTAAGYFVDVSADAYRKWAFAEPDPLVQTIEVTPQDAHFAGPIVVLTSPATASAAEAFVLAVREVADALIVGNRSFGEFSDALEWVLPNGIEFTMSMEVYTDLDGINHEAVGIPTDVEAPFDQAVDAALTAFAAR